MAQHSPAHRRALIVEDETVFAMGCQTCHTSSTARQDCLLCHKYHVNGVITPIMNTRIPTQ
jgi:hypothetical protein